MIVKRMMSAIEDLTPQQKKIVQYIVLNCEKAAYMTVAELAEACEVSDATIVRFAARMGYEHYSEFKGALQKSMRDKLTQIERMTRAEEMKGKMSSYKKIIRSMRADASGIEKTISGLDENTCKRAVELLCGAKKVYVLASHGEYCMANYFAVSLGWLRENVMLISETHSPQFDTIAAAGKEDVVLAVAFPPYPHFTVQILHTLIQRGAHSIVLTDSEISPLNQNVDCCFCVHDEKSAFCDSIAPAISLLSGLLSQVSMQNYNDYANFLKTKQEFWKEIDFYY